jgi:hypothetical protein
MAEQNESHLSGSFQRDIRFISVVIEPSMDSPHSACAGTKEVCRHVQDSDPSAN